MTVVRRVCAWCHGLIDRESWPYLGTEDVTTWGVCQACYDRIQAPEESSSKARKRPRRRRPQSGARSRRA